VLKDTDTRNLLFSYRVDHGPWSIFAPGTRAMLTDLRPGRHLFEVRAMDQDLNVDPTPAQHGFQVVRHWWREPWLIALVGLSLAFGVYTLVRLMRAVARERSAIQKEQATLEERRHFVRLASHELRKPLARLAHRAEMLTLASTQQSPEKLAEYGEAIAEDSRGLARLVEMLLDQARIQQGLQLDLRACDLSALVKRIAAELQEPGIALRVVAERPLLVRCDEFYLSLALRNLVDNAVKYAGAAGPVEVRAGREEDRAQVTVSDEGPGVPPDERERIFEPFYRGHNRPSLEHGGFGLGLSFARDIARAHAGDVVLRPTELGATFCLTIPIAGAQGEPEGRTGASCAQDEPEGGTGASRPG
jgi:signal transduction histidine kinase